MAITQEMIWIRRRRGTDGIDRAIWLTVGGLSYAVAIH
jgi:hypothetical protein